MARKNETKKKKPLRQRIKRTLVTALILILILYVGVHVVTRTEGFRSVVADKLSNATRQLITLESCGATPLLGLRLKGLSFEGAAIPDVKVSFNGFAFLSSFRLSTFSSRGTTSVAEG